MKLLIMQVSPVCISSLFGPNILLSTPLSALPAYVFSLISDTKFHTYKKLQAKL
jgi:hypothetical protein